MRLTTSVDGKYAARSVMLGEICMLNRSPVSRKNHWNGDAISEAQSEAIFVAHG